MPASTRNVRFLARSEDPGHGGGMQLLEHDGYVYMGHLSPGGGTTIFDVHDPRKPRIAGHLEGYAGTYSPKVQIGDGLLLVNHEQRNQEAARKGFSLFDLARPEAPEELAFFDTGGRGVPRMWYVGGRHEYISAVAEGFRDRMLLIVDVSNPRRPELAGRWWLPGLREGEPAPDTHGLHHNLHHGIEAAGRLYMGCWDYGLVILDVTDPSHPREVGHAGGWAPAEGGNTHTVLPLLRRGLLAVTDESVADPGKEAPKYVRIFQLGDGSHPRELARCPEPDLLPEQRRGRVGPHNLHENQPGSMQSEDRIYVSYFAGGFRVYDIRDAAHPAEVAHYQPDLFPGQPVVQTNDLFVDPDGIVYLSDRLCGALDVVELA
jgi:hypothetical protein